MWPTLVQIEVVVVPVHEVAVVLEEEADPITNLFVRFVKEHVTWQQPVISSLMVIINLQWLHSIIII